jgi:large subunit ribosomal protein L7Ae
MPKKTSDKKEKPAPKIKEPSFKPAKSASKTGKKKKENPLFEKRTRIFSVGGNLPPKRDLTRFVRWPLYIQKQRQKAILLKRLKVPPPINQFRLTLDRNNASNLFKLLNKYRPETRPEKKQRLREAAQAKVKDESTKATKPVVVKYGLNNVTRLIEKRKAKLVVIAHDVNPIETVVWLPALCRKLEIPYCIVKGKARLGQVVHKKTATVLALTDVSKEDSARLAEFSTLVKEKFNDNPDVKKKYGGTKLGKLSVLKQKRKADAAAKEEAARQKK